MDLKEAREEIEGTISLSYLAGTNASRTTCPFHNSADLDMALYHADNHWRCFGACDDGKIHTIFDWVMLRDGVDFATAFKILSEEAGVSLKPSRERVNILAGAQQQYHQELMKNEAARAYLRRRGFGDELLFERRLGYAPEWLYPATDLSGLVKVGLINHNERGSYPVFRNRIVYPVFDRSGLQVQMQGRLFPEPEIPEGGRKPPKYLGLSTDVELKAKSIWKCLSGEQILRDKSLAEATLTEGWPDRETLTAWGIPAVGLFGHSDLVDHAHKFKHLKRLNVVLDPDEASQKRILLELYRLAIKIPHVKIRHVTPSTNGLDLNDWAMSGKPEGETLSPYKDEAKIQHFQLMCMSAPLLIDELIDKWGATPHLMEPVAQLIARSSNPDHWITRWSNRIGETQRTIQFLVKALAPQEG